MYLCISTFSYVFIILFIYLFIHTYIFSFGMNFSGDNKKLKRFSFMKNMVQHEWPSQSLQEPEPECWVKTQREGRIQPVTP